MRTNKPRATGDKRLLHEWCSFYWAKDIFQLPVSSVSVCGRSSNRTKGAPPSLARKEAANQTLAPLGLVGCCPLGKLDVRALQHRGNQTDTHPPTTLMKLEICIDRIESAQAAMAGGADRIEVCGALDVGGITPSYGLVEQCVERGNVEVMMMIRPHAGGFCYESAEVDTVLRDLRVAQKLHVQGVVLGVLHRDGRIDRDLCRRLIDVARPLSITFHRAFDLTPDPLEALDCLLELGIDRLLTSGQAASAREGTPLIHELVRRAGTALSVIAGGGIQPRDIVPLIRATGVREIHASASEAVIEATSGVVRIFGAPRVTKQAIVQAMVQTMVQATPDGSHP